MAAVPDAATWENALDDAQDRLRYLIEMRLQAERTQLGTSRRRLEQASPQRILATARQRVDESRHRSVR